ncbi:hypothetical protein F5Y16DRAFT_423515 [Xylariaceae sp. FL0255]|nr:hypothetical protein F5Y16DRAFT_423515 [Xylariaceae sp. FL0255]
MHIGAVNLYLQGAFHFGGYDKNRVIGDVLALPTIDGQSLVFLTDISIIVVAGASPFTFAGGAQAGLLAEGNDTLTGGINVQTALCAPYISLPKSTCDAIASYLPVTFNEGLGLYLWNTTSPDYVRIVTSASALQFTILSTDNQKSHNFSVPFLHLNLALEEPLVDTPTPYFPCNVAGTEYGLGRAFFQDVFIGRNWNATAAGPAGTLFLAQASGPRIPASPDVVAIDVDAQTLTAGDNDWAASWAGVWTELAESGSSINSNNATSDSQHTEVDIGVKVKVSDGVLVILLVLGVVFLRRKKKVQSEKQIFSTSQTINQKRDATDMEQNANFSQGHAQMVPEYPTEMVQPTTIHEAYVPSSTWELPTQSR